MGYELGLHKDPYSRFGQLTHDMWRAVRLAVDTGMHAQRCTRHQAIDHLKDNAAKTEADIVNEIDRYVGGPGQTRAYKVGELHRPALRADAKQALGPTFDVRAFLDAVLANGAIPLGILDEKAPTWTKSGLAWARHLKKR